MTPLRFPWENEATPVGAAPLPLQTERPPKRQGRPPRAACTRPVPTAVPAWLYHHLTISGPAALVADFAEAARGSGVIPWRLDYAAVEEDVFNLAVSQPPHRRSLSVAGCHILARQLRHCVEARHSRAAARVGASRACALDLHTLLPVPAALLQLGPADPAALAWLRQNWGTTDRLRQVAERPRASAGRRLPAGHSVAGYGFFTEGETPTPAVRQLQTRWPALRFVLTPRPAD